MNRSRFARAAGRPFTHQGWERGARVVFRAAAHDKRKFLRQQSSRRLSESRRDRALMAHAKTEFEVKLIGAARDVMATPELVLFDAIAVSPGVWERLVSTYYDSEDGRLAEAGVSLRVREEGGARAIVAKRSPNGAGALLRVECERVLTLGEDGLKTGVSEIDALISAQSGDLAPIARTTTDRWSRLVEKDDALIEVSAEIGAAQNLVERRTAPIAEVELELLKGDAAALFDFARDLVVATDARLRPSLTSKLERARAAGAVARTDEGRRLRIAGDASVGDALANALKGVAANVIGAAASVADIHDSDAGRRLRVALRRLRAAEGAFRNALPEGALEGLATEAKGLARIIGAARDLDVFIENSLPLGDAGPTLRARLEEERATAWRRAGEALSGRDFALFALELLRSAWLEPWRAAASERLNAPARPYADERLERAQERLLRRAELVDFDEPFSLHALRVELKRFRYAAQFFRDLYPPEARKPLFAAMTALQDAFGAINDAVVAQAVADGVALGNGPEAARVAGFIAGFRGAEASAAAAAIRARWEAFAAAEPYWRLPSEAARQSPVTAAL
jgi:inorganic triphosphatase YgiF